jgi:hypothetical protein
MTSHSLRSPISFISPDLDRPAMAILSSSRNAGNVRNPSREPTQHSEDREGRVQAALDHGEDAEIPVPKRLRPERDARTSIIMCIRLI